MASITDFFPWFQSLSDALTSYASILYWWSMFWIVALWILTIPLILGYEPRLRPKLGLVKIEHRWSARSVSILGMSAAIVAISMFLGGVVVLIPGIMDFWAIAWAFLFIFPIVFGYSGMWGAAIGNFLGNILTGTLLPANFICNIPGDFTMGWFIWKLMGKRSSMRSPKDWAVFIAGFFGFISITSFIWGAAEAAMGTIPMPVFAVRSAFNLIWYTFFIWLYPPLIVLFDGLAKRYGFHWAQIGGKGFVTPLPAQFKKT